MELTYPDLERQTEQQSRAQLLADRLNILLTRKEDLGPLSWYITFPSKDGHPGIELKDEPGYLPQPAQLEVKQDDDKPVIVLRAIDQMIGRPHFLFDQSDSRGYDSLEIRFDPEDVHAPIVLCGVWESGGVEIIDLTDKELWFLSNRCTRVSELQAAKNQWVQ